MDTYGNTKSQIPFLQMSNPPWFIEHSHSLYIMTAEQIANHVAERLVINIRKIHRKRSNFVLTTSAGKTLKQTYAVLRDKYKDAVDWSRVICIQMDEYANIGSLDPRSFAYQLINDFVKPLDVGNFLTFFNKDGETLYSLEVYDQKIQSLGGIDCAIHGVGRNAHIALNEPHDEIQQNDTRRVLLAKSTQVTNEIPFQEGVTLGLDILGSARASIIVLLGAEKRYAAEALLFLPPGPQNPVAHLRHSTKMSIYLDQQALPENQNINRV